MAGETSTKHEDIVGVACQHDQYKSLVAKSMATSIEKQGIKDRILSLSSPLKFQRKSSSLESNSKLTNKASVQNHPISQFTYPPTITAMSPLSDIVIFFSLFLAHIIIFIFLLVSVLALVEITGNIPRDRGRELVIWIFLGFVSLYLLTWRMLVDDQEPTRIPTATKRAGLWRTNRVTTRPLVSVGADSLFGEFLRWHNTGLCVLGLCFALYRVFWVSRHAANAGPGRGR